MPRKFLVVVDDSPELGAALAYASRRARSTGGHVVLLRALPGGSDEHWSGVRDEIRRQQREEAASLLTRLGEKVAETSGAPPGLLIEEGGPQAAICKAVGDAADIRILIRAAGANGRGPGPLISAVLKQGAAFTGRKLPVAIVPGELTDEEIQDLA